MGESVHTAQLEAGGAKAPAAESRDPGSMPTPARFDLNENSIFLMPCVNTA